jgi:cell division protein FtsB
MGRYFVLAILMIAIGFAGYQIYGLFGEYRRLSSEAKTFEEEAGVLEGENKELEARAEYLANPENLINEIKSRFNYRLPGEKTILVAPEE